MIGPDGAGERPLLIDRIPGEKQDIPFCQIGQGLVTLGVIALMAGLLAALLSGPSLDMGWEGSWYVPRGELAFVLPLSLALMVAGIVLYLLGRREGRRSAEPGSDPASEQGMPGTGK
jgi:hypothetical protein